MRTFNNTHTNLSETKVEISRKIINIILRFSQIVSHEKPISILIKQGIRPDHLTPIYNQIILRECFRLEQQNRIYDPYTLNLELSAKHQNIDWKKQLDNAVIDIIDWKLLPDYCKMLLQAEEVGLQSGAELTIEQIVKYDLYNDYWICVGNQMYQWEENHYRIKPEGLEKRKIADFLDVYPVTKKNRISYIYATAKTAQKCLCWIKSKTMVSSDLINPSGLNCTNGTLQIKWQQIGTNKVKPIFILVPHSFNNYHLYKPLIEYRPGYTSPDCERMLECLEPQEQEIFLKTIAASLDLAMVRKYCGRSIKAILCRGTGSNGKDTLKKAVQLLYGYTGVSSVAISDFAIYDQGRKFPVSSVEGCRVNWASENSRLKIIDSIDSLKRFITGEEIDIERKNQDSYKIFPNSIALFNINDLPNLQANIEAILSRFCILSFRKTYKSQLPLAKNELLADPRFRYDDQWMIEEIMPAFLNKVLAALESLMNEGIDYRAVDRALNNIKQANSHLFDFCQETGLNYYPDGKVTIKRLWEELEQWYVDNGTLRILRVEGEEISREWISQAISGDQNVKGMNQVKQRFLEIFPQAIYVNRNKTTIPQSYLEGIGFQ